MLEVSAVYRTFHASSEADQPDLEALARANSELTDVTQYWYETYPQLMYEGAFLTQFIVPFQKLVINADVYRSWAVRNKAAVESGNSGEMAVLSHEEARYLTLAVEAAQTILLYLSSAARTEGGRRVPQLEKPELWKDGKPIHRPLEPDADHARHIRTAVDTVVCVMIVFSAMFLFKLRAAVRSKCLKKNDSELTV